MAEAEDFKFIKPGEVRTRFAPSPTGFLHIGSARTALFNYLFAKKNQGSFILRIEDTDIERSEQSFEKDIIESLKWLGIEWSEGPDIGGDSGPYRQSERLNIYKKYIDKLLKEEKVYHCFCTEEELEAQRQYLLSIGQPPRYNGKCSQLSPEKVKKHLAERKSSVIRFKIPPKKIVFEDLIRGRVEFDTGLMGDVSIAKNLPQEGGKRKIIPLYNLAVVIDDFEMKISHLIRGEDLLSNTPKQILIHEALDLPQPKYGHLPLILGPDRSKLSKRHGAMAVAEYKKEGYLPEALINLLALLGWNPGTEREIFSMASLIKEFSLERVQKGGAIFNIKRLEYLNGFYMRQKSPEKLTELCLPYLVEAGLIEPLFKTEQYPPAYGGISITQEYKILKTGETATFDYLVRIISIYQERLKKLSEIYNFTDFFFKDKLKYDKDLLKWGSMTYKDTIIALDKLKEVFSKIRPGEFNKENLERILSQEAENLAKKISAKTADRGYLFWPLRVALTGKKASAGPLEIGEVLGKEKVLKKIEEARKKL